MSLLSINPSATIMPQQFWVRILFSTLMWLSTYSTSLAQWQSSNNGSVSIWGGIGYGGDKWVCTGDMGTIMTSPDGINWTTRVTPYQEHSFWGLTDVRYGNGLWVAVGGGDGAGVIRTSPDGITWTTRSTPYLTPYSSYLGEVTYGGGKWIVLESHGYILTSPDGISWTAQTPNTTETLIGISYGGGQWVAVGSNSSILTSPDGITWTVRNTNTFPTLTDIIYDGSQFVAVGYGGTIITSPDGASWTKRVGASVDLYNVSYGDGKWVAFGRPDYYSYDNYYITSTNSIDWNTNGPLMLSSPYVDIHNVGYGAGKFVAVGLNTIIYSASSALPVSLVSFQGQAKGNGTAQLSWETAWEKEASHFLIERSRNAKSFEVIGQIQAQGTTDKHQQYSFLDKDLASGLCYYRLRQMDLDDTFTYSQIISVRIGAEPLETLTLSPNPGSGPMVLECKKGISSVSIHSLTGILVKEQRFEQAVERWTWESVGQPTGMYLICVQTQDGEMHSLKWVKQ